VEGYVTAAEARKGAPSSKALAFVHKHQISEILQEAGRLRLQVLLRIPSEAKVVRGYLEHFKSGDDRVKINGISKAGETLLKSSDNIRVEFVLLAKKIYFDSEIKGRSESRILLTLPPKVVAVERRANTRFSLPASVSAYIIFPNSQFDRTSFDTPYLPKELLLRWDNKVSLRIDDISLGGIAIHTRFAGIIEELAQRGEETDALICFPSHPPIATNVIVRWQKKTMFRKGESATRDIWHHISHKLGVNDEQWPKMTDQWFRVGLQFSEVTSELDRSIRTFKRAVQTAGSI